MGTLLFILALLIFVVLILAAAMHPVRPHYSLAELKRRAKKSKEFALELDRYELHAGVVTLLWAVRGFLVVFITCLLIGAFGWFFGVVLALVAVLAYPMIARIKSLRKTSQRIYMSMEGSLLDFVARFEAIIHVFREPTSAIHEKPTELFSLDELAEVIERSKNVIGQEERLLLASALAFSDKTVQTIMTPRAAIDSIKQSEFLGPLVLDELHALGHSRLPVIEDDLDHVVGVLHLRDMLSLDVKHSSTAAKAMEKKVYYIRSDDTLKHALSAFLKTRHHLFIVINENRETVGLITLEDVMEALIGQSIVDEDDIHADLRAVAAQKSKGNNSAAGHVDVSDSQHERLN